MIPLRSALLVSVVLASAFAGQAQAGGRRAPRIDLNELARYYAEQSGGLVPLAPGAHGRGGHLRFTWDERKRPKRIRTVQPLDYHLNQGLFGFDEERFLRAEGAADLVDAHWSWYSRKDFNLSTQHHDQDYYYLEGWEHLFHPPVKEMTLPKERYFKEFTPEVPHLANWADGHEYFSPEFQKNIDRLTGTQLTYGNRLTMLPNSQAYAAKMDLVKRARRSLYVGVMFWACDATSSALRDELVKKMREGVEVRLVTERFYREFLGRRCIDRIEQLGIPVLVIGDSFNSETSTSAYHQKFWIRDGEEVILGGMNILDYENEASGFNGMNRDTDVRVVGPSAKDAQASFMRMWKRYSTAQAQRDWADERLRETEAEQAAEAARGVRGQANYATWLGSPETRMNGICRTNFQGTMARVEPIAPVVEEHLRAARKLTVFSTPDITFSLDDPANAEHLDSRIARIMRLLTERNSSTDPVLRMLTNGEAGGAGEVSIWMQYRTMEAQQHGSAFAEQFMRQWKTVVSRRAAAGNRKHSTEVMHQNPQFRAYTHMNYVHEKVFLFDRIASFISSWNLDLNSADINHEVSVTCLDESLRQQLEHELALDLANAVPMVSRNGK
ncbi:MAG: phosphatidylserine/phosphatidylglycerophosphate/cardiolipin synthase family protein [Bdellovibrionales bacterium]|nr:phosphatidylserine/phosphatidylglycerophosphate/cardiolipin synthase family protein [Bdellovibrionales bacterium]